MKKIKEHQTELNDEFLSRTEIATMFKVSIGSISNWTNSGILTAYSLGARRVIYKRSEVLGALIKLEAKGLK